jgi:hypothetical protein
MYSALSGLAFDDNNWIPVVRPQAITLRPFGAFMEFSNGF